MNDERFKNKEEDLKKRFARLKEKAQRETAELEEENDPEKSRGILPDGKFKRNMGCGG